MIALVSAGSFRETQLFEGLATRLVLLRSGETLVDQPREHEQDDESSALHRSYSRPCLCVGRDSSCAMPEA